MPLISETPMRKMYAALRTLSLVTRRGPRVFEFWCPQNALDASKSATPHTAREPDRTTLVLPSTEKWHFLASLGLPFSGPLTLARAYVPATPNPRSQMPQSEDVDLTYHHTSPTFPSRDGAKRRKTKRIKTKNSNQECLK